jgi:tetratricopeptide (TPR) repeat protein
MNYSPICRFLTFLTILLGAPLLSWAESAEKLMQKAEIAWENRDAPGQTETAIAAWEAALKEDARRTDLYIPLTKAACRAYRQAESKKERLKWVALARSYGEQAVKLNKDTPQAYAEYGAALGQWAQAHKGIRALSVVKEAVKHLEKAVAMDPHYAHAHMLLARFYLDAPRFSVGDKTKAYEHAQLAVEYGGNYVINRMTLEKVLIERGEKEKARQQLEAALKLRPPPDAIPETGSDQRAAKEMLNKL